MAIILGILMLALGSVFFFVIGYHFRRGKWLRLIAGNTMASREFLESPFQIKLGRRLGIAMYIGGVALAIQGGDLLASVSPWDNLKLALDIILFVAYFCLILSFGWVFWESYLRNQK